MSSLLNHLLKKLGALVVQICNCVLKQWTSIWNGLQSVLIQIGYRVSFILGIQRLLCPSGQLSRPSTFASGSTRINLVVKIK